jgi:16S rRNA (uracil1498-N3)-methyltransferase
VHRVLIDAKLPGVGEIVAVEGEEAHHALRVKRLRPGDHFELLNGRGEVGVARVIDHGGARADTAAPRRRPRAGVLLGELEQRTGVDPVVPRVEIFSAVPKGSRADDLVDQLAQVGAALWRPLSTRHGVVDLRSVRLDRLARIAREAAKQSGRPWLMDLGGPVPLDQAPTIQTEGQPRPAVVIAHPGAPCYRPTGAGVVRLLIGPEAGFSPDEVESAVRAGATPAGFGPHVMRIETAAAVAAAIIIHAEQTLRTAPGVLPHTAD